ncbi:MAG: allophanate hydrolase [Betaproteobacteria bacterium]|nr:allophanate hydrolase [Betaproteobacteria bacterium]
MPVPDTSLDLTCLREAYLSGKLRPGAVVDTVHERVNQRGGDKVWIDLVPRQQLDARAAELEGRDPATLTLYGVPFAIKDNIDLAGRPTTAACPDYAYTPATSAAVVQRLLDAGAIAIGKTNLDQFATGLVGTRSPYGAPGNVFDPRYISGGSSSGSAVAVAAGLVSFALGTDTAGSGRVPAAFNNLVGVKPTCGLLSARGVVPACRSLDCVSLFALNVFDACSVLAVAQGFDREDPFSRHDPGVPRPIGQRFGVPRAAELEFFGDGEARELFERAIARLEALGGTRVEIDFRPFIETARLLYEGPWVAERWLVARELMERKPEALLPVTRKIIEKGATKSAADAFAADYRLRELKRATEPVWEQVDLLVTPTAGTIYTQEAVNADPIELNSRLGYYTNFVNLLDLCALAVPAGFRTDGLPFGITLVAPAFQDHALCELGARVQRDFALPMGATGFILPNVEFQRQPANANVRVAVCGAHMSGLPLNRELTERGGRLVRATRSAPCYRLFALEAFSPPRPGMLRTQGGGAMELEVWELPASAFGGFVDSIPSPLGIGTVELEDGEKVRGFLCEHYATHGAREITQLGGWRAYLKTRG